MRDHRQHAAEAFLELRAVTLREFSKSHGIKLGRTKKQLVENILNACSSYEIIIQAVPGGKATVYMDFTPDATTSTTTTSINKVGKNVYE